ncbi:ABC transporter permease [Macrococcoides canis]|uniref:Iron chelate uptake ABC transporter family permease subunit n=1 Tax=Macrococcoides canis TaxID=1855823 RepID=A0A6G7ETT4_9STAP|nr:iron chelate uptake ABC transporter family permease subunit [Macrococcus canis]MCO4097450.1 iron chelate uptake ABC transporter family permease subunit [Macrococcus canis]QIH76900.1 iron chelate uptake ABC transporter family permease subunit [Macrococcus canis]QIH79325.1 iron chelate uptake ABC transporter family permease subunit [Macrococcus canis]QNR08834.1 iron chelate uptake ABC transporter family permease subunit [Macrococcus canis]QUR94774.1 iron chelate uptake ABC transporter family 
MKIIYTILLLLILSIISMFIGVVDLSPSNLLNLDENQKNILLNSRLPRTFAIILAGVALSVAGLLMQQLTRNKFVSPTTAGTMDFAKFGVLIAMIFFAQAPLLIKLSFSIVSAIIGTMMFMWIVNRIKFKDAIFIPLVGLMLGNIVSSLATFMALRFNAVQSISNFFVGDFSMITKGRYEVLFIIIPMVIVIYLFAHHFTIVGMGESFSKNLGISYAKIMNLGVIIAAIVSATVVVTIGVLPFLGLIIPNIVGLFVGDHMNKALPYTALFGAILVMVADIFSRLIIFPYEIPIGLTLGIVGSVIFMAILLKRRKSYV